MENQEKEYRINVALTSEAALDAERLRCQMELKLNKRLSMAKVFKLLIKQALEA